MERQTALAEAIDTVADKAKYDRCAKKLLSFKAIDALDSENLCERIFIVQRRLY